MSTRPMLLRALGAFLLLPGLAALLAPPIFAWLDPWRAGMTWWAVPVMVAGLAIVLRCVRDFLVIGRGTLAPWDPPRSLVVVGLYRHVRNPMYVGVLTLTAGWALTMRSPLLAAYTVTLAVGFHVRVVVAEEPWLASQFGAAWAAYRAGVRRWLPRLRPWVAR